MPFHQTQDDYHPTRLLDGMASDGPATVRLIESRGFVNAGPYSALSHCWGGTSPIKLTKNSIHALRKGLDLSELPETFQHAILIARFISIRYLWIDSLCIVQDSYQDWERESCLMKDVYKNALLTIAATGAVDSTMGCFFEQDVDAVSTISISVCWYPKVHGTFTICDSDIWDGNVFASPLNQRASVVQERLLSPRILRLGRDQIAWECQETEVWETFPNMLPSTLKEYSSLYKSLLSDCGPEIVNKYWDLIAGA